MGIPLIHGLRIEIKHIGKSGGSKDAEDALNRMPSPSVEHNYWSSFFSAMVCVQQWKQLSSDEKILRKYASGWTQETTILWNEGPCTCKI